MQIMEISLGGRKVQMKNSHEYEYDHFCLIRCNDFKFQIAIGESFKAVFEVAPNEVCICPSAQNSYFSYFKTKFLQQ